MTDDTRYLIVGIEKAHQDLHFLRRQARTSSAARQLYREILREIERLRTGATDGHHALGCEPGKGDLRDCVTAYIRSDPERKADYRLVFREMAPTAAGQLASPGVTRGQTPARTERRLRTCLRSAQPSSGRPAAGSQPLRRPPARWPRQPSGPSSRAGYQESDRARLVRSAAVEFDPPARTRRNTQPARRRPGPSRASSTVRRPASQPAVVRLRRTRPGSRPSAADDRVSAPKPQWIRADWLACARPVTGQTARWGPEVRSRWGRERSWFSWW